MIGTSALYSTFLGGIRDEIGTDLAVDEFGAVYVTGQTDSSDFPITPGAFQVTFGGRIDAFVAKLHPTGSAMVYSTFLGGNDIDAANGVAIDANMAAYVTGRTLSLDFPIIPGAFQPTCPFYCEDAFISKLDIGGSALVYSTFLGGHAWDMNFAIAVDASGEAYTIGITQSPDFPTMPGAFRTTYGAGECTDGVYPIPCLDIVVTRLSAAGNAILYSTYFGGWGNGSHDRGNGIALDASGAAYITGHTQAINFPTTPGAFQPGLAIAECGGPPPTNSLCYDAFISKMVLIRENPVYLPIILDLSLGRR
jgi:hypothetical protein